MVGCKIWCLIACVALGSFILATEGARSKAKSSVQRQRGNKSRRDQTTVVSCRVFRRGVCPLANKIKGLTGITSHGKCQEACYSHNGCSAFTYYRKAKRINCNLFSNCNGKLGKCTDCVSGPVMPRVRECLAERITAPSPAAGTGNQKHNCSCHNCCTAVCIGPKCPEIAAEAGGIRATTPSLGQTTKSAKQTLEDDYNIPSDDYNTVEDSGLGDVETIYDTDYYTETDYDDGIVTAASAPTTEDVYDDGLGDAAATDDYYDTDYLENEAPTVPPIDGSDVVEVDLPEEDYDVRVDTPLESEGIEEEEDEAEEVEMNIDSGLLSDSVGTVVDLPSVKVDTTQSSQPTYIFYFCAVGGFNTGGSVGAIDMLNLGQTGALVIPPLPGPVTQGTGEVMASYTGNSILTCSPGYTLLTPYGFQYLPGTCYDYSLAGAFQNQAAQAARQVAPNNWQNRGGKMSAYRQGASIIRLGRYMLAIGGHREKRKLRSIEAFDPKRPRKGWRRVPRMLMPTSATQHCAVTVKGDQGKEIIIIGGKGRENRVLKYGVNANRWYSLNRLTEGRRKHACAKVKMNGRPGVIVSGGRNRQSSNLTSVEFYDSKTGVWFKLPDLNIGRVGHQMTLRDGKLTVIGGETVGRRGRKLYLDNSEVFTGRRWVKSKIKLDKPRSGFSMVKIPRKVSRGGSRSRNG